MAFVGEGLGAAGTRLTKRLGPDDEIWAYVWQAVVGAVALDLVLTLTLLSYLIIGWGALIVFLSAVGFLIGLVVLLFGRPQWEPIRFVLGNLWGIGAIIGAIVGQQWYALIASGLRAVGAQLSVIAILPWWAYVLAGALLLVVAVKLKWKAAVALLAISVVAGIVLLSDGDEWLAAWHALKWLLVPYSWPVIGFALLLALVMAKEMLFPSLEWTFQPVSLEELREVGLIGLWMPGVVGKRDEAQPDPEPSEEIAINLVEQPEGRTRPQTKRARLPGSASAKEFYRAVHRGESFSLRTARKYGVGRAAFNGKIRDGFIERGLARWKNPDHPEQGVDLLEAGERLIEHLALVGTTQ